MYVHFHDMHIGLNRVIIDYNNVSSHNYVHRLSHTRNEDIPTVGKVVLMNVAVVYMPRTIQNCFLRYR